MKKKKPKQLEVQQFGGVNDIGATSAEAEFDDRTAEVAYDVKDIEAQSTTKLEEDSGYGATAIVRCFEFGMNPEAFRQAQPTKQELFNAHLKGIEITLWRDGMKIFSEVEPRIVVDEQNLRYKIFVAAKPNYAKALIKTEEGGFIEPMTLKEIVHGRQ